MASGEVVDHRSFLGGLEPADRAFLLRLGHPKRFRKGARIIVQGDHSDTVFLTLSGLVKVTLDTPDGREIVLAVLGAGDLLGEFEVIEGTPQRAAGNVAVLPVECRVIPADEFMASLETHPQMLLVMVRVIISRLRAADRRREASASMGVSRSLAGFLVELLDRYGTSDGSVIDISIHLTQEELASLMSTSRDSAVRGLSTLRTKGLIATHRRQIVVTDLGGLRRYASAMATAHVTLAGRLRDRPFAARVTLRRPRASRRSRPRRQRGWRHGCRVDHGAAGHLTPDVRAPRRRWRALFQHRAVRVAGAGRVPVQPVPLRPTHRGSAGWSLCSLG